MGLGWMPFINLGDVIDTTKIIEKPSLFLKLLPSDNSIIEVTSNRSYKTLKNVHTKELQKSWPLWLTKFSLYLFVVFVVFDKENTFCHSKKKSVRVSCLS